MSLLSAFQLYYGQLTICKLSLRIHVISVSIMFGLLPYEIKKKGTICRYSTDLSISAPEVAPVLPPMDSSSALHCPFRGNHNIFHRVDLGSELRPRRIERI
jgi:hypothetical protein